LLDDDDTPVSTELVPASVALARRDRLKGIERDLETTKRRGPIL